MIAPQGFADRVVVQLTLSSESESAEIAGGQVEQLELQLAAYGFRGEVSFFIDEDQAQGGRRRDPLEAWFAEPSLIELELELGPGRPGPYASDEPETLKIAGIVQERRLREQPIGGVKDNAVMRRHYGVTFADPARVLWTQHFPYALYTQASIQDLLEDQKGDRVDIDHQWSPGSEQRPFLFLGLDGVGAQVSFYDFAFWLFEGNGARFTYDYANGGYILAADKPALQQPPSLLPDEVARLEHRFPEIPRCGTRTRNSYSASPATEEQVHDGSESGVFRDVLLRTPVRDEASGVLEREAKRVQASAGLLRATLASFPDRPFAPGAGVRFDSDHHWGVGGRVEDTEWRVREVELRATAQGSDDDAGDQLPSNDFRCEMSLVLEHEDEETDAMPGFAAPESPHLIEGVIVSEAGPEPEETYQTFEDQDTSQLRYRVKVPLFDDQVIHVPFDPCFSSGHYYTPAYRDERVLLAFGFERVEIHRFLDWRDGIREERDQLNRIQMGKAPDNRTSISHYYDGENPVLAVGRRHDRDTATIELSEGALRIEVREQDA